MGSRASSDQRKQSVSVFFGAGKTGLAFPGLMTTPLAFHDAASSMALAITRHECWRISGTTEDKFTSTFGWFSDNIWRELLPIRDSISRRPTSPSKLGHGYVVEYPNATIVRLSEEHGVIELPEDAQGLKVGDRLEIIPNHVCPTVNLQDEMFVVRDGAVLDDWEIIARGKVR